MKKLVFVCLGNICRSPMAEFVMKDLTADMQIESRATSDWEHGNPIHQGTQKIFRKHQIAYNQKKTSQQISARDFADFDYIIGMDESNVRDLREMAGQEFQHKIYLFGQTGVPDPWYTGNFDETYELVQAGCRQWLERLDEQKQ